MTKFKPIRGRNPSPVNHVSYPHVQVNDNTETSLDKILDCLCNSDEMVREWAFQKLPELMDRTLAEFTLDEVSACSKPSNTSFQFYNSDGETFPVAVDFQEWPSALQERPVRKKQEIQILFRIWKSLFNFLYLTDGQDVQDTFIDIICDMENKVHKLRSSSVGIIWTFAAWYYLAIKWKGIDQWRIDKYLYFARKLLESTIRNHQSHFINELLKNFYVYSENKALGLHIIDVFLDASIRHPAINAKKFHDIVTGLFFQNSIANKKKPFNARMKKWIMEPIITRKVRTEEISAALPMIIDTISHLKISASTSAHLRRMIHELNESIHSFSNCKN